MNRDEMIEFLENNGIKITRVPEVDGHYDRTIEFHIYNLKYTISWYVNQSKLYIGDGGRCAFIPFRYLFLDLCYPIAGANLSIGFSQTKKEKVNMFDREYPFECFRIPLEI